VIFGGQFQYFTVVAFFFHFSFHSSAMQDLDQFLGLSELVLGISFSHVSSSLVPSQDGRTPLDGMRVGLRRLSKRLITTGGGAVVIKRFDIRGRAAHTVPFMLVLQVEVQ